jgi:hypothetical protein
MEYEKLTGSLADAAIEPEKVESSFKLKEVNPRVIKNGAAGPEPPPPPPPHEEINASMKNSLNKRIINYI